MEYVENLQGIGDAPKPPSLVDEVYKAEQGREGRRRFDASPTARIMERMNIGGPMTTRDIAGRELPEPEGIDWNAPPMEKPEEEYRQSRRERYLNRMRAEQRRGKYKTRPRIVDVDELRQQDELSDLLEDLEDSNEANDKAKVRNRPDPVFDDKDTKVKDDQDHFPIDTIGRARNALARVNQYDKAPSWWGGTLEQLKNKVYRAVKNKYPSIDIDMKKKAYLDETYDEEEYGDDELMGLLDPLGELESGEEEESSGEGDLSVPKSDDNLMPVPEDYEDETSQDELLDFITRKTQGKEDDE